jgi:hypothetical protein
MKDDATNAIESLRRTHACLPTASRRFWIAVLSERLPTTADAVGACENARSFIGCARRHWPALLGVVEAAAALVRKKETPCESADEADHIYWLSEEANALAEALDRLVASVGGRRG